MTDEELLLAISDIVEKKIRAEVGPLRIEMDQIETSLSAEINRVETSLSAEINRVETSLSAEINRVETSLSAEIEKLQTDVTGIKLDIENVVKPQIRLLAENYLPAAKRYEKATEAIEAMKSDMSVMKNVIRQHSERLQQLA